MEIGPHRIPTQNATAPFRKRDFEPVLWVYWNNGFERAPPVVRACFDQIQALIPEERLVVLDKSSVNERIDIPGYVHDRLADLPAHFADVLRVCLLAEHGGVWTDATCLLTRNVLEDFDSLTLSDFFAFSRNRTDQYMLSNWFLAARPHQCITAMMRDILLVYWQQNDRIQHYFMFHYLFEALYNQNADFRLQWDRRLHLNAYDPHLLQAFLPMPFDQSEYARILATCPVHKLTYKLDPIPGPGTVYHHIVEN